MLLSYEKLLDGKANEIMKENVRFGDEMHMFFHEPLTKKQLVGDVETPQRSERVRDDLILDPPDCRVPHLLLIFAAIFGVRGWTASPSARVWHFLGKLLFNLDESMFVRVFFESTSIQRFLKGI